MFGYPLLAVSKDDHRVITSPLVPEFSYSQPEAEELEYTTFYYAFANVIQTYYDASRAIPPPIDLSTVSAHEYRYRLYVPVTYAAKVLLWNRVLETGIPLQTIANELGRPAIVISKVLGIKEDAPMRALEEVAAVLGCSFHISLH